MIQTIVGISFNPVNDDSIKTGSDVNIIHDRDNKFSSRAIAVMFGDTRLGHIGEKANEKHEEIFNSLPLKAKVHTIAKLSDGEEFAKFKVGEITHLEVEFPMSSDAKSGTKSFNEEIVLKFDPKSHRYTYNGAELISATNYIKRWVKEFDKETISFHYAKKLGCKQSEVLDFWNGAGKVSADFGTSVHNALEHYEKFKKLGKIIQDKKELEFNKALPTHPALRKIVSEFIDKFGDHEVETEIVVTNVERGLCGMIDRLKVIDSEKKICRVEDYKINVGAEKKGDKFLGQMAELPANKLSKYRLQMSFYARLLELSGWRVEGLTAYIYEDQWKKVDMEIIKLDF